MTGLVELTVEDKVAIVTLNRPEVRNAINDAMRTEFVVRAGKALRPTLRSARWC